MNRIEFLCNLDKYKGEDHSVFLEHYGILGQKWGQRRWQNADGTFNEAGKERYFGKTNTSEEKIGSKTSDVKDYLKIRNKLLKERTRPDLNEWYRDKNKYLDKQLVRDAKRMDKAAKKMYENQLKDFYDDPNELVADLKSMYRIGGKPGEVNNEPKSKKEIGEEINKRNSEMLDDENEDMLIGSNPDKKAYKAKVKELKQQAKEMGIPFGERGHLAKYCAQNGIDEITDKIVEGHKAGDELWKNSCHMNASTNQFQLAMRSMTRGSAVRADKNVKEFTENNKNFKQFRKELDDYNNYKIEMLNKLNTLVKKSGIDLKTNKITNVEDANKFNKILDKYMNELDKESREYKVIMDSEKQIRDNKAIQEKLFKLEDKARASLSHFEKDCHDFAKEYLVDQAEYDDPFQYAWTYEKDTGKTRSTKMYETYGYLMTEPWWSSVGGA